MGGGRWEQVVWPAIYDCTTIPSLGVRNIFIRTKINNNYLLYTAYNYLDGIFIRFLRYFILFLLIVQTEADSFINNKWKKKDFLFQIHFFRYQYSNVILIDMGKKDYFSFYEPVSSTYKCFPNHIASWTDHCWLWKWQKFTWKPYWAICYMFVERSTI